MMHLPNERNKVIFSYPRKKSQSKSILRIAFDAVLNKLKQIITTEKLSYWR